MAWSASGPRRKSDEREKAPIRSRCAHEESSHAGVTWTVPGPETPRHLIAATALYGPFGAPACRQANRNGRSAALSLPWLAPGYRSCQAVRESRYFRPSGPRRRNRAGAGRPLDRHSPGALSVPRTSKHPWVVTARRTERRDTHTNEPGLGLPPADAGLAENEDVLGVRDVAAQGQLAHHLLVDRIKPTGRTRG